MSKDMILDENDIKVLMKQFKCYEDEYIDKIAKLIVSNKMIVTDNDIKILMECLEWGNEAYMDMIAKLLGGLEHDLASSILMEIRDAYECGWRDAVKEFE